MLDLQANSLEDENVKLAITDGKNRVSSMATIHQMLYQEEDAGNIFFKEYINKLVNQIMSTFSHLHRTKINIDIPEDTKFNIDTSIPLGLIVTELFTNALKYGVADRKTGCIDLIIRPLGDNNYTLKIKDNGPGLPEGYQSRKSKSLGLRLVKNLSKQIKGNLICANNDGAEFSISFKGESFNIT